MAAATVSSRSVMAASAARHSVSLTTGGRAGAINCPSTPTAAGPKRVRSRRASSCPIRRASATADRQLAAAWHRRFPFLCRGRAITSRTDEHQPPECERDDQQTRRDAESIVSDRHAQRCSVARGDAERLRAPPRRRVWRNNSDLRRTELLHECRVASRVSGHRTSVGRKRQGVRERGKQDRGREPRRSRRRPLPTALVSRSGVCHQIRICHRKPPRHGQSVSSGAGLCSLLDRQAKQYWHSVRDIEVLPVDRARQRQVWGRHSTCCFGASSLGFRFWRADRRGFGSRHPGWSEDARSLPLTKKGFMHEEPRFCRRASRCTPTV